MKLKKEAVKNGEVKQPSYPARSYRPVKLKDKPGRGGVFFNLKNTFGFVPEIVVIQKVWGEHDKFVFSAILTPEELVKEKAKLKNK
jgi:hypothetical protein